MSGMDAFLDDEERKRSGAKPSTGAVPVDDPFSLDLFAPVAHARRTDPPTSQRAAADLQQDRLRVSQQAVLRVLEARGPMTDEQLVAEYEYEQENPASPLGKLVMQSPSGIRTRRNELARAGDVVKVGTGKTKLGRDADIWRAK